MKRNCMYDYQNLLNVTNKFDSTRNFCLKQKQSFDKQALIEKKVNKRKPL